MFHLEASCSSLVPFNYLKLDFFKGTFGNLLISDNITHPSTLVSFLYAKIMHSLGWTRIMVKIAGTLR
jgi:hypothetical protein